MKKLQSPNFHISRTRLVIYNFPKYMNENQLCKLLVDAVTSRATKQKPTIRQECEELMSKGITGSGQGFDIPGKRLGGFTRQRPLPSLRATTATAAEKRVRQGNLLPSGPQHLGGDSSIMSDLSPIQVAAMAAERRLLDDIWCGSQST